MDIIYVKARAKKSCRSFGCPHVGNQDFVNLFNTEVKEMGLKCSEDTKFVFNTTYLNHLADSHRYAIRFDPVPLLLEPMSSYRHVDELIEIPDLLGKHKIEYYIIVLVRK